MIPPQTGYRLVARPVYEALLLSARSVTERISFLTFKQNIPPLLLAGRISVVFQPVTNWLRIGRACDPSLQPVVDSSTFLLFSFFSLSIETHRSHRFSPIDIFLNDTPATLRPISSTFRTRTLLMTFDESNFQYRRNRVSRDERETHRFKIAKKIASENNYSGWNWSSGT